MPHPRREPKSVQKPEAHPEKKPVTSGSFVMIILGVWALPIAFFVFLAYIEIVDSNKPATVATAEVEPTTVTVITPDPDPDPAPVPPPSPVPPPPRLSHRATSFSSNTGIDDRILFQVYEDADTNGDQRLNWSELVAFQRWVYGSFRYQFNDTALRPDQFGVSGGGDCEDYSLYTCGLLQYWGIECYVGVFADAPSVSANSHAVALVPVGLFPDTPATVITIHIDSTYHSASTAVGRTVIPIDYDAVGHFTNATPNPRYLIRVYVPKDIYGWRM